MRKVTLGTLLSLFFVFLSGIGSGPVWASSPARLLATLDGSGGGGATGSAQAPAVAMTFCVGYGLSNFALEPLPSSPLATTVGCDQVFFPGQVTSVDYNASNAPDFSTFVNLITNTADDTIWTVGEALDSQNVVTLPDVGAGRPESVGLTAISKKVKPPDLAGFRIDFVRLEVMQVHVSSTGSVDNEAQWSVTWQFWGRPVHP